MGIGLGDPQVVPAAHTDLILAALGEEWGFLGVAAVFALFAFLVTRAFRAATRSATRFGFFLALGLGALIAFEMLLISSGVLGALPLSGVVSPFLSSGNTAMLANFAIFALILSVSADAVEKPRNARLIPLKLSLGAAAAVLLGFAAHYQVLDDRE
jgi:cell division protein FtsW (lipid II flippase)